NNPNAVIIAGEINGTTNKNIQPLIVTLSNPEYNANKNILQFLAKPLASQKLVYKDMNYQYVTLIIE
ncbi:MAG: hypothetical protein KKC23_03575, partial [Proteobacteria bacterium]|nr:hypothetical protein [Pseudomonadota bacterium]